MTTGGAPLSQPRSRPCRPSPRRCSSWRPPRPRRRVGVASSMHRWNLSYEQPRTRSVTNTQHAAKLVRIASAVAACAATDASPPSPKWALGVPPRWASTRLPTRLLNTSGMTSRSLSLARCAALRLVDGQRGRKVGGFGEKSHPLHGACGEDSCGQAACLEGAARQRAVVAHGEQSFRAHSSSSSS